MTPKKAITIVLILFVIMMTVFIFLYVRKQAADRKNGLINDRTKAGQNEVKKMPLTPADILEEKINKIVEEARENPGEKTPAQVNQEVVSTINAEIIKQEKNKTPEQKAADLKAQADRQKIIDQINQQIKEATR